MGEFLFGLLPLCTVACVDTPGDGQKLTGLNPIKLHSDPVDRPHRVAFCFLHISGVGHDVASMHEASSQSFRDDFALAIGEMAARSRRRSLTEAKSETPSSDLKESLRNPERLRSCLEHGCLVTQAQAEHMMKRGDAREGRSEQHRPCSRDRHTNFSMCRLCS